MKPPRRQSFEITLTDGELVRCSGWFEGTITDKDREEIACVVSALKKTTKAERIESATLTKADLALIRCGR